ESATELTKQLLGFAREGKYEVKPTDLNELVKDQNRLFSHTKKEITIHSKYEENLWTTEVDRGQIEQVLMNIYVNAWQAMPDGGELHIQTENVKIGDDYKQPFHVTPGKYVKISVTDTGTGMDDETRKRIFDPFFTTKEKERGTGMGLSSAYGIIKNHEGFITVDSEPDVGSTFTIYLPASRKKVKKDKKPAKRLARGSGTILLIDDEQMMLDVGKEMLKELGYDVLIARAGNEGVKIYKKYQEKIDMVILDMIMPGTTGGDVYDSLKEINHDIKVLLSSGYSINGKANIILERGCNGFIQKPFNMEQLSLKISEILSKK
ncbi:MAG: response regulator, partial [Deltaproteobacteria bacterium]|nr:response regulator [Deltaproteobacteria bacterium]